MDCRLICFGLCLAAALICASSCSLDPQAVDRQIDEKIYALLEDRWDPSYGSASDYQIDPFFAQARQDRLREVTQTQVLTLSKAAELLATNSHEYQTAKEQMYLAALDQKDVEHLYEWIPFSRSVGGYATEGGREGLGVQNESGVSRLLAAGTAVSSGFTVGYMNVLAGDFRTGLETIFQAAVTQPLLRGADRKVVLEALTQAQRNTLYEIRTFNRFRQTFLVLMVTEYYRLLQYDAQLKNTERNYIRLLSILDKIKPLVEVGRLPAYELEQAQQDKIKAWDRYIQARQLYHTQLDALKLILNIPLETSFEPDQNEWQALLEGLPQPPLGEEEAVEAALNQRLDLANAYDQVLDAQRHTEVAADALKADLRFVGLYSPTSDNSRRYAFGADPGDLQRIRDRYEAAVRLDLPLDREMEKTQYKRTLIFLAQQQRNHQKLADQITLEVRKAYRDAREAGQRYRTLKEARQLAQQRLDNTLALMQYARADSRDVLDAQKDYYQAQTAFAEAVFHYSEAILNLYRDTGMLWIKPNGLWETRTAAGNQSIKIGD